MTEGASRRLGDVVQLTYGNAFQSSAFSDRPVGPRLLRGENIGFGETRWDLPKWWPADKARAFEHLLLMQGDIVLAMDRPWLASGLKFALIRSDDVPALLVQRTARLRGGPDMDQGFLRWIVSSQDFADYVVAVQTGSTIPHISGRQIADYWIPNLPPLAVQRWIADILGALDDKIESNRRMVQRALACLDGIAAAVADLPVAPLSYLVSSSRHLVDPSTIHSPVVEHFSLPAFDIDAIPDMTDPSTIKSAKFAIRGPKVLVSRLNPTTPRVWFAVPEAGVGLGSTEFLVLDDVNRGSLASVWLAVTGESFTAEMQRRATGTSGSHQRVRSADALAIEVPDARLAEPDLLDEVDSLLHVTHQARVESRSLTALRESLLPELLSGRLRVPEAREREAVE